jgi:diguanylate cyclase (GGDEF)-like protein/PAS domain S-box-containing protein
VLDLQDCLKFSSAHAERPVVTATDHEFASPQAHPPFVGDNSPSSILSEIEALAALVGESEEHSDSPIPAPTASIARSRPVLAMPPTPSTPSPPAPVPLATAPAAPALDPTTPSTPTPPDVAAGPTTPVSPRKFAPVVDASPSFDTPFEPVTAIEPMAAIEPAGTATPVDTPSVTPADTPADATVPLDRFHPGDIMSPLTVQSPVSPNPSSGSPYPSGILSDAERLALLDAMPVAVFLIDSMATVRYANERTASMIGLQREDILGRNVLDFVNVEDLDFAVELFNVGTRYNSQMMGPSRMRYVDADGCSHWTQVWAQDAPESLGVKGFIITLTSESVRDVLATAVTSVAADDNLDHTLAAIALSARALPFLARGAIVMIDDASIDGAARLRMIGDWPIDHNAVNALGTPWRTSIEQRDAHDIDDVAASGLAPGARQLLGDAGVAALFVRPIIDADGAPVGAFVVFRSDVGPASPNQNDHLDDAVRLTRLACAQKRRRLELETAALRDFLTGVGNRAAFNDRLKTERRAVDVLFIDLDHFKAVNDTYGHEVGDHVIAMAAGRIERAIRQDDKVYRTGGDEFVVVCEASGDDPAERIGLAERIVERLDEPFAIRDHDVRVGATVGIAAAAGRSLTETLRAADRALYTAKERGRSGWAHDGL